MQLFVRTPHGTTITVDTTSCEAVSTVLGRIQSLTGMCTDDMRLFHEGRGVSLNQLVGTMGNCATVHLMGRLRAGAHTAHKDAKMMEEVKETDEAIQLKCKELSQLIREARHVVVFTGAGISTSAGIPDYRGPQGVWTLMASGGKRERPTVDLHQAIPTTTHMSLVALVRENKIHHIISQNVDGMHRKSGIPPSQLSELHGNTNLEICSVCHKQYMRDYSVRSARGVKVHWTGRRCAVQGCKGRLKDTIVNFTETLPITEVTSGFSHSEQADLHIVLGSSLTVSPACEMPKLTSTKGGKLVIVNLQRTPLDTRCCMRLHAPCDLVMRYVMENLGVPIPGFVLKRHVALWRQGEDALVTGVDVEGVPASLFRRVSVQRAGHDDVIVIDKEPFSVSTAPTGDSDDVMFDLEFYGHYNEPNISLTLPHGKERACFDLTFDPAMDASGWDVQPNGSLLPPDMGAVRAAATADEVSDDTIEEDDIIDTTDYSQWHAVQPLEHCPHLVEGVRPDGMGVDLRAPCVKCGNVGENMLCMQCHTVCCGRHVKGHMVEHGEETSHPLVCGFIDLSFWCYRCDAYIVPTHPLIHPVYSALHVAKFGKPPPSFTKKMKEEGNGRGGGGSGAAAATSSSSHEVETEEESTTVDTSGWHAVTPLRTCPHVGRGTTVEGLQVDLAATCESCGNTGENMLCLQCHTVLCGRHVQGHMVQHGEDTGHPLVCGFIDLSFWCYPCEAYIDSANPSIRPVYSALHTAKFGRPPARNPAVHVAK